MFAAIAPKQTPTDAKGIPVPLPAVSFNDSGKFKLSNIRALMDTSGVPLPEDFEGVFCHDAPADH
jgi:hypothetical protein